VLLQEGQGRHPTRVVDVEPQRDITLPVSPPLAIGVMLVMDVREAIPTVFPAIVEFREEFRL
jgi:hypothetical protein